MNTSTLHHLKTRWERGVLVLTIAVPHIRSAAFELVDALRQELFTAIAEISRPRVAVDLSAVEYFGSAGVRPLLSLRRQIQERGGELVLCHLSPEVEEVLRTTRLISPGEEMPAAFDVEPDVAMAVARLASGAA